MNKAFFLQLVFNASLLLTLTLIYNLVAVQWRIGRASLRQVPVGVVIGIMGVIVMLASWQLQPGIIFDTRSILLAVSGLFFGTIPTVVAMAITIAFRGSMGGVAVGMGVAVIFTSGAIGIAWRHMRRPFLADITWRELYLFGLVIHLAMLGWTFILPGATKWYVLANVALPVILIYPAVTAVLGKLMADYLKREKINEKLRESEERYQNLAKISPVGIFRTDKNGATTYVNPMWCRIAGLPEAKAMGDGWLGAVHADDRESLSKGWQETIRLQKPSLADYRFLRPDGTIAWVMGQATPEMNSENQIVGYVGTITDISERRRAEQELHESEARYRAFFITSRDCVFITSLTGKWLHMNDAAVDLFGYASRVELSQVNISDHFAIPEEWAKYISIMLEQGYTKEFPVDLRIKDGILIHTLITAVYRYDADGNVTGFQGTIRDITERRRAEEAVRASLAEKEVLLKEVHHRVKNNLMTVIGLIKMQEAKANNKMFTTLLLELEGRLRAMALVHENLHKSENLARIDLQNYIETICANIRAQFGAERDIGFSVQAAGMEVDLNSAVPCGLILNELITNAFKHAFPGDKSRSGEGNCEIVVTVKHEGGMLTLTVADNGFGLPADLDWVNPQTLGMQLIKMLSKQLNGSIELDRSAGATFHLRFAHSSAAS